MNNYFKCDQSGAYTNTFDKITFPFKLDKRRQLNRFSKGVTKTCLIIEGKKYFNYKKMALNCNTISLNFIFFNLSGMW